MDAGLPSPERGLKPMNWGNPVSSPMSSAEEFPREAKASVGDHSAERSSRASVTTVLQPVNF